MGSMKGPMASEDLGFPLFPKLPTEIRVMIWIMSFESRRGRVVEVKNHEMQHLKLDDFDSKGNLRLHLWSPSPPPDVVNVCHESRDVARQVATKSSQFLFQSIFFDPVIDTLYVPMMEQHSQTEEDPYSAKCHKAILVQLGTEIRLEDVRFYARDLESNTYGLRSDLCLLPQLKKITLVVPDCHERLVENCTKYFKYSRRMVSSLAAQEAYRSRKAGRVKRRYPEVCPLAMRQGRKLTLIEPPP